MESTTVNEKKPVKRAMLVYKNSLYDLQEKMEKYLNNGWEQIGEVHSVVTYNNSVIFYVKMVKCEEVK